MVKVAAHVTGQSFEHANVGTDGLHIAPAQQRIQLVEAVTEVGQLELWCYSRDGKQKWKLEYNVREEK